MKTKYLSLLAALLTIGISGAATAASIENSIADAHAAAIGRIIAITNTKQIANTDISKLAQTTLSFGEGGFSYISGQIGSVPRWLSRQFALIPQLTLLESRHLDHVVVVR